MKIITYGTLTLEEYVKEKLAMLSEFHIRPKCFEIDHLKSLKTEIQVDNYVRSLLKTYL